jgi:hypothetical protein
MLNLPASFKSIPAFEDSLSHIQMTPSHLFVKFWESSTFPFQVLYGPDAKKEKISGMYPV